MKLKVNDMKLISILAASVFLACSATASFAAFSFSMQQAREMNSNAAYANSQLTTGRSMSESRAPLYNCQSGEPSISPNGIATLSDMAVCR